MLRFFRILRRKLLENGNFQKYFWYALGEILLVVIGILIALQINNWNEERKERDREQAALERLFDESQTIVLYFRNEVAWIQELVNKLDATTKALSEKTHAELPEDEIYLWTSLYPTSWPPRGVYDELTNSGQFKEITSDTVRSSIIDYYRNIAFFEGQLDYFRSSQTDPKMFAGDAIRNIYDEEVINRREFVYDLESLANNERFISALVDGLRNQIQFQAFRQYVLDSAIEMCKVLANELEKTCTSMDTVIENPSPNVR